MRRTLKPAVFVIFCSIILLSVLAAMVYAEKNDTDTQITKISELPKEEISEDSNAVLAEQFADVLGMVKTQEIGQKELGKPRFNNIATSGNIAVINVSIDGKDRRLLTRIRDANILSASPFAGGLGTVTNLIVLGNLTLKNVPILEIEGSYGKRQLYGTQSAIPRYIDEGSARLKNGVGNISINPILRDIISSYTIFLTPQGLTRGIYVAEKAPSYFVVKSIAENSSITFSWMLRASAISQEQLYLASFDANASITATVYYENQTAIVTGSIIPQSNGEASTASNSSNGSVSLNQTSAGFANLLTGNVVLSEDLQAILEDTATPLPTVTTEILPATSTTQAAVSATTVPDTTVPATTLPVSLSEQSGQSVLQNQTPQKISFGFTLYDIDEDAIISQAAQVSGLSATQVKRAITFIYPPPAGYADELIDLPPVLSAVPATVNASIDGIRKVNGSVVITLG